MQSVGRLFAEKIRVPIDSSNSLVEVEVVIGQLFLVKFGSFCQSSYGAVMAATPDRSRLSASFAAIGLIAARGTFAVPIRELASAAGVSERTFYRWFPRKEDCLRPVLEDATAVFDRVLRDESPNGWRQAVVAAFAASVGGDFQARTRALLPVIASTPELEAVWDHESRRASAEALTVFAPELRPEQRAPLLRVVGALMQFATDQAARSGADPVEAFERDLAVVQATFVVDAAVPHPSEEERDHARTEAARTR